MEPANSFSDDGSVETVEDSIDGEEDYDLRSHVPLKDCTTVDNALFNSLGSVVRLTASNGNTIDPPPSSTDSVHLEPEVGMVFYSEEQAYAVYNTYAKRKGFSVKRVILVEGKMGLSGTGFTYAAMKAHGRSIPHIIQGNHALFSEQTVWLN
ncbi:hypothetical protein HPP92_007873 [Vanilla planifolia]|uniref:Uncharacterized protein n=1 Tax=Vanilla planifolia TaxID=51239 RepID=A0A835RMM1_VANPL|nr:hypothetical protein HPP92_007873 [Vanilla planifolia]